MLDPTLSDWLDRQADALDRGDRLVDAGLAG
ncbi:hypothetical protein, partial [Pseudomonas aeruginosa]